MSDSTPSPAVSSEPAPTCPCGAPMPCSCSYQPQASEPTPSPAVSAEAREAADKEYANFQSSYPFAVPSGLHVQAAIDSLRAQLAEAKQNAMLTTYNEIHAKWLEVEGKLAAVTKEREEEMLRVKACEHIAEADPEGWETLSNLCPSTAAVYLLRKQFAAATARAERLAEALVRQHRWHLDQTDRSPVYFGDTIGQVNADEYADSELCEITIAALAEDKA